LATIKYTKDQVATAIAIFFHAIGLVGILFLKNSFFITSTPINLLLMFVLLVWTQNEKNKFFFLFTAATIFIGITVEIIGVNTNVLFGHYSYGEILGFKWQQVPLIIGTNWFIIVYCCGISIQTLLLKTINKVAEENRQPPVALKALSVIIDGATLATLFDWLIEPVAVKLHFWQWNNGHIPVYNYICWLVISIVLLVLFHFCNFNKQNKFAIHLLMIQFMFFLILRTFL
jgi:bisanhydrobacterioruberin hydratase